MFLSWVIFGILNIIILGLGILVLAQDSKNKINKSFFLFIVSLVVWIFFNFFENEKIGFLFRLISLKIDFSIAPVLVFFLFLFSLNFSDFNLDSRIKYFLGISLSILSLSSFSNYLIEKIEIVDDTLIFQRGILFGFYAFSIISLLIFTTVILVNSYRKSSGIKKIQYFYVLTGLSITAITILFINLILPQFIFIPVSITRFGSYSLIFFILFTTIAIARYHLFNIKVILTEILVGLISVLLFIQLLISHSIFEYLWKGVLLLTFLIFGYLLIKSVLKEVRMREEVERLNKAKSEFLSIVSHQLRTPLTAVKGYISMIREGSYGRLTEKQKKPLENVFASNERLIKLVNDILNLSRLEAGRIEINLMPTSLEEIIKGIVTELRINADKKKLALKIVKPKENLPDIMIDGEKMRQVILNIIDNAIKYTKTGGITISFEKTKSFIVVEITDTGMGMTEKEIRNLFQMFSRASAGNQMHTEGAGIGLYIAKEFIEMHNGKIWVVSEGKEKGTSFFISLPMNLTQRNVARYKKIGLGQPAII